MTMKISPDLRAVASSQRMGITEKSKWLNNLPIDDEYKVLFMEMNSHRGWQNIQKFETELVEIYENRCDVLKMFLEGKLCGLSTVYQIAMKADRKHRAYIYQLIKNGGIKGTHSEVEKFLQIKMPDTLDL